MTPRFAGKRLLVTGGSRGIGLAGAQRLAEEGAEVLLSARREASLTAALARLPASARGLCNDAAQVGAEEALTAFVAEHGPLDGLWLNAGQAEIGPLEALTAEAFDRVMALNARAPALQLARLQEHLAPGASVVITASSSAYESAPLVSLYAGAKGALLSMARCWAAALAPRGIRVNVLVPGAIATQFRDFLDAPVRQAFESALLEQVPLARAGTPEEAAQAALFLLSEASSYMTGSQLVVDGGLLMR